MKSTLRVGFRVDASREIGSGHLARCLVLADALKGVGVSSLFICRQRERGALHSIRRRGHAAITLPPGEPPPGRRRSRDVAWLGETWLTDAEQTIAAARRRRVSAVVVDHFGIDARWERRVGAALAAPVVAIDGQADRTHACRMLIDPSYSRRGVRKWKGLVPRDCSLYVGPEYHFFRPEFFRAAVGGRRFPRSLSRVVVAFGGVDRDDATGWVLDALDRREFDDLHVDVIVGKANPNRRALSLRCAARRNVTLHVQPVNVAQVLAGADLAIGAGGTMSWERAYLRLPSIVIAIAANQEGPSGELAAARAIRYLGRLDELAPGRVAAAVRWARRHPRLVKRLGRNARALFGQSPERCVGRVAARIRDLAVAGPAHG